ncbi:uncharacterized protein LOC106712628 [Papilio machaon]|uniref:uncharacterized protein LOC106712628 n=1 Tax=Papilio machaon TaxID=76193 RepID=UPI001E6653EB|nr:uncharacterized protein LOC106712628 [Papilio machaon]
MSTIQDSAWSKISGETLNPKEKCLNITEEIYKRINITFQIKKLETGSQSDISDCSDQIDSNELSNETDLFACDKSSLSSSTDQERAISKCEKYININNNEETKLNKPAPVYKRPRKRFRKRVKKHQANKTRSGSDCSSDEAIPLSRVDIDTRNSQSESPDSVMGVPNIIIVAKESKQKPKSTQKNQQKQDEPTNSISEDIPIKLKTSQKPISDKSQQWKHCPICSLSFRGERGLRRHMTMSHIESDDIKDTNEIEKDVKSI